MFLELNALMEQLVSDTKITTHYGNDDSYDDKITVEIPSVLTALSGSRESFEEFRMRLLEFVREEGKKADKISMDKLLINIGHIMDYLYKHYSNYPFDLLVGKTTNLQFYTIFIRMAGQSQLRIIKPQEVVPHMV